MLCYHRFIPSDCYFNVYRMIYWHVILDTWYRTPVLDLLYLTLDIWHRYLICYYLTPDRLILDTWYLAPVLDMLLPDTWYITLDNWHAITYWTCFHMVLVHLTGYCDTWMDTITPDTCITLRIHDYHFYGNMARLLYCYHAFGTPELLYSWTPEIGRLLILYSCWSP